MDKLTIVNGTPPQIPAFYLTMASAKFKDATCTSNSLEVDVFRRKYIIAYLILTLGQGQTQRCRVSSTSYNLCTCKV